MPDNLNPVRCHFLHSLGLIVIQNFLNERTCNDSLEEALLAEHYNRDVSTPNGLIVDETMRRCPMFPSRRFKTHERISSRRVHICALGYEPVVARPLMRE